MRFYLDLTNKWMDATLYTIAVMRCETIPSCSLCVCWPLNDLVRSILPLVRCSRYIKWIRLAYTAKSMAHTVRFTRIPFEYTAIAPTKKKKKNMHIGCRVSFTKFTSDQRIKRYIHNTWNDYRTNRHEFQANWFTCDEGRHHHQHHQNQVTYANDYWLTLTIVLIWKFGFLFCVCTVCTVQSCRFLFIHFIQFDWRKMESFALNFFFSPK